MTGPEFRANRVRASLSIRKAATTLGVSASTIQRWEKDGINIPSEAADQIRRLGYTFGETHDPELTRAYRLGRLYGVLDAICHDGISDGIKFHISDAPARHFPQLLQLAHQERFADPLAQYREELTDLMGEIPPDSAFPAHLSQDVSGQFWIGYYHWRGDQHPEALAKLG